MPHTNSAKKRLRQNVKHRQYNRSVIKDIRDQLKAVAAAAEGTDVAKLQAEVNLAAKRLDKAAAHRVIHPNNAARKKSQLGKLLRAKAAPAEKK